MKVHSTNTSFSDRTPVWSLDKPSHCMKRTQAITVDSQTTELAEASILNRGHRCNKEGQRNLTRYALDTFGLRVRVVGAVNENTKGWAPCRTFTRVSSNYGLGSVVTTNR